jgi:hypothetical protein
MLGEVHYLMIGAYQDAGGGIPFHNPLVEQAVSHGDIFLLFFFLSMNMHTRMHQWENREAGLRRLYIPLPEEAVSFMFGMEKVGALNGFGSTQQEVTFGQKGIVEKVYHLPLHLPLEVDEYIPAYDHIEAGEGRVAQQIVGSKHY